MEISPAPALVIVTGPPASGKSTIARQLSSALNLPFFQKDAFKELLADKLKVAGLEWSRTLGSASFEILFLISQNLLSTGQSVVLEGNFSGDESSQRLRRIVRDTNARVLQVSIHADGELLLNRYEDREEKGERHPIHIDRPRSQAEAFRSGLLCGELPLLDLDGDVIRVETSDFSNVRVPQIASQVQQCLSRAGAIAASSSEG